MSISSDFLLQAMMHTDIRAYVIVELLTTRNAQLGKILVVCWNIVVLFVKYSLINRNVDLVLVSV